MLIVGDSGVGKSESSIELVARGHRFVSDDVVEVRRLPNGQIIGRAPILSRYFMELRGLGIINIRYIFGVEVDPPGIGHRPRHPAGRSGAAKKEYDRLGLPLPEDHLILGVRIPSSTSPSPRAGTSPP
ncbi:MAG: hypothetical protein MZW92_72610 [Comamonadaceae bacterium]|nr:hypothetical protein [Comamonadaceae bacterium]